MSVFVAQTREKINRKILNVRINEILPNPQQPRRDFDQHDLDSLAESIKQNGILQPLTVRKGKKDYELIAGERRLRAAKIAGLNFVPCIVMDISDRSSAILSLVENIQRQNLSFFDEALAIERLIEYYGMTQEDAAMKLGKAQSTVANKLRLLQLDDDERDTIITFGLTERHARALLRLKSKDERSAVLDKIIKQNLNVEKTDKLIDTFMYNRDEMEKFKKRCCVLRDVRLFINTINKAVETMKAAGIDANASKIQQDGFIEYIVKIPVSK